MKTLLVIATVFLTLSTSSSFAQEKASEETLVSGVYKDLSGYVCDAHLTVNHTDNNEKQFIVTFAAKSPYSNCLFNGLTTVYEYRAGVERVSGASGFEDDLLVVLQPISEGGFLLKYLPNKNNTKWNKTVQFVKK